MPTPERPEPASRQTVSAHELGPAAQILLRKVQEETGYPVRLRRVSPSVHATYGHIEYATKSRPYHVLAIARESATPFLDHVIAHECAHALRFYAVPANDRYVAFVDNEHRRRAGRQLVPAVQKSWHKVAGSTAADLPEAKHLAEIYHEGIVGQVTSFPADMRIETWISQEFPDLRPIQETSLRENIGELQLGLLAPVRETIPSLVFRVATSLNAAYCAYMARLLGDRTLVEPFRRRGFGTIGDELTDGVWQTRFADYTQDRRDTTAWARRFGVDGWFSWQHYPPLRP